jgi:putative spermidine/putrescine transport system permease protein
MTSSTFIAGPRTLTARRIWRTRAVAACYAGPGFAFLTVFFLYPVIRILVLSAQNNDTGALTMANYTRAFGTSVYLRVLNITFTIATETTALCLLLGYPLAYWLTRLSDRRRAWAILLVIIPFWTSALVKTFAWIVLLSRNGLLDHLLLGTGLGDHSVVLLHGRVGVMIGMVHAMLPLAVITMLPVMMGIDRNIVLASQTLGASSAQTFWRVFFHLSVPGVAAAGLLVFITSLGFFITPALLGGPQDTMLAQLIILQVQQLLNWGFAGALAAIMVVATLLTCWVYDLLFGLSSVSGGTPAAGVGQRKWLRTIGVSLLAGIANVAGVLADGVAFISRRRRPGWSLPCYSGIVIAFLIAPTFAVLSMGFSSAQFLQFPPPGLSDHWFRVYFSSPAWLSATFRSFVVAFATALAAVAIGGFAALALAQSRSWWSNLLFGFFLAPMIVPRIVTAVGLYYFFARIGLVATNTGLVIGHTVLAVPFVFVTVAAVLKGYDWQLDQAAGVLGANRLRTMVYITVPLLRGGLIAAALFAFSTSFDDLTVALFVSGGIMTTLPKQMWDDMILQVNPTVAAASVVVFVVVTALILLAERLRGGTEAARK